MNAALGPLWCAARSAWPHPATGCSIGQCRTAAFFYQEEANVQRSHTKLNSEYLKCNTHSWAQRKLSPLNILLLITGPLLSLGFNGFND